MLIPERTVCVKVPCQYCASGDDGVPVDFFDGFPLSLVSAMTIISGVLAMSMRRIVRLID